MCALRTYRRTSEPPLTLWIASLHHLEPCQSAFRQSQKIAQIAKPKKIADEKAQGGLIDSCWKGGHQSKILIKMTGFPNNWSYHNLPCQMCGSLWLGHLLAFSSAEPSGWRWRDNLPMLQGRPLPSANGVAIPVNGLITYNYV